MLQMPGNEIVTCRYYYEHVNMKHRCRLHGGHGGDHPGRLPHGQKIVGAMPWSRPHRNFVIFWNSKMFSSL